MAGVWVRLLVFHGHRRETSELVPCRLTLGMTSHGINSGILGCTGDMGRTADHSWANTLIDGLVQDCRISSALALEILQSCTKPSICILTKFSSSFGHKVVTTFGTCSDEDVIKMSFLFVCDPADTTRNDLYVEMPSRRRFDVIMTLLWIHVPRAKCMTFNMRR